MRASVADSIYPWDSTLIGFRTSGDCCMSMGASRPKPLSAPFNRRVLIQQPQPFAINWAVENKTWNPVDGLHGPCAWGRKCQGTLRREVSIFQFSNFETEDMNKICWTTTFYKIQIHLHHRNIRTPGCDYLMPSTSGTTVNICLILQLVQGRCKWCDSSPEKSPGPCSQAHAQKLLFPLSATLNRSWNLLLARLTVNVGWIQDK